MFCFIVAFRRNRQLRWNCFDVQGIFARDAKPFAATGVPRVDNDHLPRIPSLREGAAQGYGVGVGREDHAGRRVGGGDGLGFADLKEIVGILDDRLAAFALRLHRDDGDAALLARVRFPEISQIAPGLEHDRRPGVTV